MIPCLLCPSPRVADGLCVPCGGLAAAATLWLTDPARARGPVLSLPGRRESELAAALDAVDSIAAARDALARLDGDGAEQRERDAAIAAEDARRGP